MIKDFYPCNFEYNLGNWNRNTLDKDKEKNVRNSTHNVVQLFYDSCISGIKNYNINKINEQH